MLHKTKELVVQKKNTHQCLICSQKQAKLFSYRNFNYYRCLSCAHVTTYPYPTRDEMEKHYQKKFKEGNYQLAQYYAQEYKVVYRQFVDLLEKELKKEHKSIKGLKVLDVGCFTGDFLVLMKEAGADVYGLELQEDAVKIANKKLHGRVKAADVMTDAFPKIQFDVITLLGIVEHVTDPIKLIRRSTQLLKKDGILMVQTPNSSSLLAKLTKRFWPPYAPVEHIHLFSRDSLLKALNLFGYKNATYTTHIKKLPLGYVYNQFQNFGPEFYRLLRPLGGIIAKLSSVSLPFYGGEMIMIAKKSKHQQEKSDVE